MVVLGWSDAIERDYGGSENGECGIICEFMSLSGMREKERERERENSNIKNLLGLVRVIVKSHNVVIQYFLVFVKWLKNLLLCFS